LRAADGKTHVLPNGVIQGSGLTNHTTLGRLRINLVFGISYDSDIDKAKAILAELMVADERVLKEPPAGVAVQQLADSSVSLVALPFVEASDFSAVQADMLERVMREFDAAGIVMPYPTQEVHLVTQG
jgi:small conductance mechanosensitive channel